MKPLVLSFLILFSIASCTKQEKENVVLNEANTETNSAEIKKMENWLKVEIEKYFNTSRDGKDPIECERMLYTSRFSEFWLDAVGTEYDGGMSDADFHKKWDSIYPLKDIRSEEIFLVPQQDFGKIKIDQIKLLSSTPNKEYWFSLVTTDQDFKTNYTRKVKVIPFENSCRIDEVRNVN